MHAIIEFLDSCNLDETRRYDDSCRAKIDADGAVWAQVWEKAESGEIPAPMVADLIGLQCAKVLKPIRTSAPWCSHHTLQPGEIVIAEPANNMPADSPIRYWLRPIKDSADWYADAVDGYGIGAYADDIEIIAGD